MAAATVKLLPRHIAIIMDGNGRWAAARGQPRPAGHRAGLKPVRMCIEECAQRRVEALTLFAFSSENWGRPAEEVGSLMSLFLEALDREIAELHHKRVRVRCLESAARYRCDCRRASLPPRSAPATTAG